MSKGMVGVGRGDGGGGGAGVRDNDGPVFVKKGKAGGGLMGLFFFRP